MTTKIGKNIYLLIKKLFPIRRTLSCSGNRLTLKKIKSIVPTLKIIKFKSKTKVYDWKIPYEWEVKQAYIKYKNKKIINYQDNQLHLVGYSKSIKKKIDYKKLLDHLHTKPNLPEAIPYITSYYKKTWGFCIAYNQFKKLKKGTYEVLIKSKFKKGTLDIGEIYIPGKSKKEILISTNICHPNMVNNELCGPAIITYLAKYFMYKKNNTNLSLRFVFFPETIGAIAYINKKFKELRNNFIAGYHITCFGDKGPFSLVTSKYNNSYSDIIAKKIIKNIKNKKIYSFKESGSDERQYNFPGIDLPVVTLTRSKFGKFKEYHTSLDNFDMISLTSLTRSFDFLKKIIKTINLDFKFNNLTSNISYLSNKKQFEKKYLKHIQRDYTVKSLTKCEPFLTKRKLYRTTSDSVLNKDEHAMFNLLYYADNLKLSTIANYLKIPANKLLITARMLQKNNLISLR